MLKAKGLEILDQIKENDRGSKASYGWLQKLKQRFDARFKISEENLSAQPQKEKLKAKTVVLSHCEDRFYNVDESGLYKIS